MRETKFEMLNRKTAGAFGCSIKVMAILDRGDFVLAMTKLKKDYLPLEAGWIIPILYSADDYSVRFMGLKKLKIGGRLFGPISTLPVTTVDHGWFDDQFEIMWQITNRDDYQEFCNDIFNSLKFPEEMVPSFESLRPYWVHERSLIKKL